MAGRGVVLVVGWWRRPKELPSAGPQPPGDNVELEGGGIAQGGGIGQEGQLLSGSTVQGDVLGPGATQIKHIVQSYRLGLKPAGCTKPNLLEAGCAGKGALLNPAWG